MKNHHSASLRFSVLVLLALAAPSVLAHSFGKIYTLPVPVWLYLYGGGAALVLTFLLVGYFVKASNINQNLRQKDLSEYLVFRALVHPLLLGLLQIFAVTALTLTIVTGFLGSQNSYANFSMSLFWIVFFLGYSYLTAVIGNTYAQLNPWEIGCDWLEKFQPGLFDGHIGWPTKLAYWPAVAFYIGLIWYELFGESRPFSLAAVLSAYSLLNLIGAYIFGRQSWFKQAELFAVLFRILGMMAPFTAYKSARNGKLSLVARQPFMGLTQHPVTSLSLLVFVLFMLSSTAFDGFKSTVPYVRIYWVHVADLLKPFVGNDIVVSFPLLKQIHAFWQAGVLIALPFIYLAVYWFFCWLTKLIIRSDISVRVIALRFGLSLVPIAFVYNFTHYYTLLLTQGAQILKLASDPFGVGWNLFGTAGQNFSMIVQADTVWHTQVGLIVFGHMVSVYLAHMEALTLFGDSRRAALSQIPMLVLMVGLTVMGLWILSLPISSGAS
ncbi:MAG: hypothetical protein ACI9SK_001653 [Zhongshania sp.]